ncbi:MAG: NADH-quinone oxidoreductase subunit N [Candidatus Eiseniibacteriota bacterium]|nr:MAG: NADH-quinone oxidoreductase subunit N [Candidatus Eisenbacteria bacterium]
MSFVSVDFGLLVPELVVLSAAFLVLVVDLLGSRQRGASLWWLTLCGLGLALLLAARGWNLSASTLSGTFVLDPFVSTVKLVFLLSAFLVTLTTLDCRLISRLSLGEYYSLLLFATFGFMVLASAGDLIMIFIGLEMASIPCYILAGYAFEDVKSNEAGIKYFLLGAFSSAILLYGMSFLYGLCGSTFLSEIGFSIGQSGQKLLVMGAFGVFLAGLTFKMTVVPFHMWVPDTYEGSPTPVAAFFSVVSKTAGLVVLIRILAYFKQGFLALEVDWTQVLSILSVLTMVVGTVIGVVQTNVKRLLAYSSIAHVGYLLIGLCAGTSAGIDSIVIYLFVYLFMSIGAFAVVTAVSRAEGGEELANFRGLNRRSPLLAASMAVFLISLTGIPPLAGFIGKFFIFAVAIEEKLYTLAIVGVLTSVVSLFYYCKILKAMYFAEAEDPGAAPVAVSPGMRVGLVLMSFFTLALGLYPVPLVEMARSAVRLWLGS